MPTIIPSSSPEELNSNGLSSNDETLPTQAPSSVASLKARIRHHYEICSEYYHSLWGEHIHHGYFLTPNDTKELAQTQLIELLLSRSALSPSSTVLDVGCGVGGTARYLARERGCRVTGITISGQQVSMARTLTSKDPRIAEGGEEDADGFVGLGEGVVRFEELDAECLGERFGKGEENGGFDCVWISEALSHLLDKVLFFRDAAHLVKGGGKVVIADWFSAEGLTEEQVEGEIRPIEDGMLLPRLYTQGEYVELAKNAGLEVFSEPMDISKEVAKTWDISWSLIQSPALWALAVTQGRDGIAFFQAFRAMRRGFANETFRYAVMVLRKP